MRTKKSKIIWLVKHCSQSAYVLAIQILGDGDDAKDAVQLSLSKVLVQTQLPEPEQELKIWFKRIVRNTAIDKLRSSKRQQEQHTALKEHQEIQQQLNTQTDVIQKQQQQQIINACLQKLNFEHREIILLRDYHGHSYEEITNILSIPKGTIMSRLHRARIALRNIVKKLPEGDL